MVHNIRLKHGKGWVEVLFQLLHRVASILFTRIVWKRTTCSSAGRIDDRLMVLNPDAHPHIASGDASAI